MHFFSSMFLFIRVALRDDNGSSMGIHGNGRKAQLEFILFKSTDNETAC